MLLQKSRYTCSPVSQLYQLLELKDPKLGTTTNTNLLLKGGGGI